MNELIDESAQDSGARDDARGRIVEAAAKLLAAGGRDAATTRAVAADAGVQAPTIYRLFGDMGGLLDAVAEHVFARYVAEKAGRAPHPDPIEELRRGWDEHIGFSLAHPAVFAIMRGEARSRLPSAANDAGRDVLRRRITNIARAGRLRVSEARALALVQAVGTGTILALLDEPAERRDPGLSAAALEAVIAAITVTEPVVERPGPAAAAVAMRALLPETAALTESERRLMAEWLDRIADAEG